MNNTGLPAAGSRASTSRTSRSGTGHSRRAQSRIGRAGWLFDLLLGLFFSAAAGATTYYTYDNLGRVTQVIESDGSSTQYTYDANGNVTSITRGAGTHVLSIGTISSGSGAPGSSITITGTGFSSIPAQDIVTFNGVAATVTYASDNRIVVTVPDGASTGNIAVTTPNGSMTSANSFTVVPVSVGGFSPSIGLAGTVVTVNGGGFDPNPANDIVSLNGTAVTVSSATSSQLQFTVPTGATAGHITVTTSQGTATSSGDFLVPASGYTVASIAAVGQLAFGGVGRVFTISTPGQVAVALFDGVQGQNVSAIITNTNLPADYRLYAPDGSVLATGLAESVGQINLPTLTQSGTYAWYFVPGMSGGSATLRLVTDALGSLTTDGAPQPVSLAPGQNASYTFTGVAGQNYNLALTQFVSTPANGWYSVSILRSDGSTQANCNSYTTLYNPPGSCQFALSASGTYTVRFLSGGLYATSFNILLAQDLVATLTAGTPGPTTNVNLVAAQRGRLNFTAAAGQTLALYASGAAITPVGNSGISLTVYDASGNEVASGGVNNGTTNTLNMPNLSGGTYTVTVIPSNLNSAPASLQLNLANGLAGTVPLNGSSTPLQTYVPGQYGYLSFSGTAGQSLAFAVTQLITSADYLTFNIYKPDGGAPTSMVCYTTSTPGCGLSMLNLPETGTYNIVVIPHTQATMSFTLTASVDTVTAPTLNTAMNFSLSSPGQSAALTVTVTAGQPLVLNVANMSAVPANSAVVFYIYDSAGNYVTSTSVTASSIVNLGSLAPGRYTILIAPNNAATASLQVTLQPGAVLQPNGNSINVSTSTASQRAYLSFTANAGDNDTLAITGLSTTPAGYGATFTIYLPNSATNQLQSFTCTSSGSCEFHMRNLPQTGTYTVTAIPSGPATMGFTATLSADLTGTLTAGTPLTVNLAAPGQSALISFTLSSAQTVALNVGSLAITPSGTALSVAVYSSPSGTVAVSGGSTSVTATTTLNMPNLSAGTYTIVVSPLSPATGSYQLTLQPGVSGVLSTSNPSGSTFNTLTTSQNAYLSFTANAGDSDTLAITGFSTNPGAYSATFIIYLPNSTTNELKRFFCSSPGGCEVHLRNLPQTGTYTVVAIPAGPVTMNFTATLSADLTGTLTAGTPLTVNLAAPGQSGLISFTLSSAQPVALNIGSLAITPSGTALNVAVYSSPSGTVAVSGGSTSVTATTTLNMPNMSAGTYTIVVSPLSPVTGSYQLTLQPGVSGVLSTSNPNGSTFNTLTTSQNAYLSFTANAGDNDSLAITGFSTAPSAYGATFIIYLPNSTTNELQRFTCGSPGSCQSHMRNLPQTGTYTVIGIPSGPVTMSFTAILSQDVTGSISSGTSSLVTLGTVGQSANLALTVPSQEGVTVHLRSIAISPASAGFTISLYNSTGTLVTTIQPINGATSEDAVFGTQAAGTYSVTLVPNAPVTGSLQTSYN